MTKQHLTLAGLMICAFAVLAQPCHARAMPEQTGGASPKHQKLQDKTDVQDKGEQGLDISAEQSLEYYQDKRLYVARGQAKAVKGLVTIEADILTAHQREPAKADAGTKAPESAADDNSKLGDIDIMTAEGNVHISDPRQQVFGQHGVYDLDQHVMKLTGDNLRYQTEKEVVTAKDSLEYYEMQNIAVARGGAMAVQAERRIEADVLTAQFTEQPNGTKELTQMVAEGHVTVVTKGDIARGDRAVYNIKQNTAVLTGHVRITRDGTQLAGERAESDFASGHSRLLGDGKTRVHALLTPKPDNKDKAKP